MADCKCGCGVLGVGRPAQAEIDDLIRRAKSHPLGADFLANGALDSVAATFHVHAFVVDAAREALRDRRPSPDGQRSQAVVSVASR